MGGVIHIEKRTRWTGIANQMLEDDRLSFKARGLLAYLLSKPEHWQAQVKELVHASQKDGRSAIYSALDELVTFGYATYDQPKIGGRFSSGGWTIRESPCVNFQHTENPHTKNTYTKNTYTENRHLSNYLEEVITEERVNTEEKEDTPLSTGAVDIPPAPTEMFQLDLSPPVPKSLITPAILVALYNAETPQAHPKVRMLSAGREAKARAYLKMFPDLAWWQEVFRAISTSPFLRGEKVSNGHASFRADFDWLLTKGKDGIENCVKVADGRYDEPARPPQKTQSTGWAADGSFKLVL